MRTSFHKIILALSLSTFIPVCLAQAQAHQAAAPTSTKSITTSTQKVDAKSVIFPNGNTELNLALPNGTNIKITTLKNGTITLQMTTANGLVMISTKHPNGKADVKTYHKNL